MQTFKAKVHVTLKKSVLDPQGNTILEALHSLGFKEAENLRVGKYFEVALQALDPGDAKKRLEAMSQKLFVNPVIEEFEIQLV